MGFDLSRLITTSYFFDKHPGGDFNIGYFLIIFFLIVIFWGKIFALISTDNKYLKKSGRKKFGKFVFLGLLGESFLAARFSAIPFFSMRFFLYATILLIFFFAFKNAIEIIKNYKKRINSVARERFKKKK
jgi:hypothetical protein